MTFLTLIEAPFYYICLLPIRTTTFVTNSIIPPFTVLTDFEPLITKISSVSSVRSEISLPPDQKKNLEWLIIPFQMFASLNHRKFNTQKYVASVLTFNFITLNHLGSGICLKIWK